MGKRARLLSLSGGNRWKLANAKDILPVEDVTGMFICLSGNEFTAMWINRQYLERQEAKIIHSMVK